LLPHHNDPVVRASFSGDIRRLVTASKDGSACVWDVATGRRLFAPLRHGYALVGAEVSPDGRLVSTLGEDRFLRTIRVWDAATGEPVTPGFRSAQSVLRNRVPQRVVFAPAGYRLHGYLARGGELEWDLTPDERPVRTLVSFAEVLSGHRIDPVSGLVPLEGESFQRAWIDLRTRYPQSFASSPRAALAWHDEQADACREEGQWAAAVWHLDYLIAAEPKQWRHHRDLGDVHAGLKQWQQALADYSRTIELYGDDVVLCETRGQVYAVLGQWDKAAADYTRAIEATPDGRDLNLWYPHALLRLAVGDAKGYRQACRKLSLEGGGEFWQPARPSTKSRWVWACVLAADALEDYTPLLGMAEKAVRFDPHDYACARALGGALLRAGRLDAAVQQLQKADSLQPGASSASLLLALGHHRLGHADEARRWLDKAMQRIEQVSRQRPKNTSSDPDAVAPDELPWTERLSVQLLRREAETLIQGPAGKGKGGPAEKK
jgi:tetratricopeptide (TPR) repeat protein